MKRRPSLLKKIWRKLAGPKPAPAVKTRPTARKVGSSLEVLEGRISPATLINPTTVMFKDLDGDIVTVKFTKGMMTSLLAANNMLKFSDGTNPLSNSVIGGPFNAGTAPAEQLQLIDLTAAPSSAGKSLAIGTGVTVTVVKAAAGNGSTDIGYIKGTGLPLGAVSINGDLGQIDAGAANVATGLTSLKTKTLGLRDPGVTQAAAGRSLVSNITGALGSLTVTGDVTTASVLVVNSSVSFGKIGAVTIGGSLKGRPTTEALSDSTGLISAATDIGAVKIGTLLTDGIVGGGGVNAGSIQAGGKIASLTVSGDITGGSGVGSGAVVSKNTLGAVIVKGSLRGGLAKESGAISGAGIGAVTIGGSILAGGDTGSGMISSLLNIGAVKVTGNIDGSGAGTTAFSIGVAGIRALGTIGTVTVIGKLQGGSTTASGFIESGLDMGAVTLNAIAGGAGTNSGSIFAGGKILTASAVGSLGVTVKLDVTGGAGIGSGSIFSGVDPNRVGDIGPVKIGGKLVGGTLDNSGTINSGGKITSVTIGPAAVPAVQPVTVQGGAGNFSGSVVSRGAIGAVKITGHVEGGGGIFSGSIASRDLVTTALESAGSLGAVTVTGHVFGGNGADSGEIRADGKLASALIGELKGGVGDRSGSIRAGQGGVQDGLVGAVTVKGAFTGGAGAQSGNIISEGKITSVLVTGLSTNSAIRAGDNLGTVTFNTDISGVTVSARGLAVQAATSDLAIAKISVLGNATGARFLGGYTTALAAVNPDAQIGPVFVKNAWTAGDIVAGVADGGDAGFGTVGDVKIAGTDNVKIVSQIASIVIGGSVTGTVGGTDHFGFTAQKIVAMKVGPTPVPFTVAPNQSFEIAATSTTDVTAREVAI